MPHKARKIRRKRGSRTHGAGRVGQNRKGSKGRRKAGRHKGGWTYVIKYEPHYFGKKGFISRKDPGRTQNIVNVGDLEELVDKHGGEKTARRKEEKALLDLTELGYDKLLGKGRIISPIVVKVSSCSELAAKKIEGVGGQVIKEV